MAILHSEYFYFREDTPEELIQCQYRSILKDLSSIRSVNQIMAGPPLGVKRDVVDNDYGMSLHILLNDRKGLHLYQKDPIHLNFLKHFGENWRKVKVYDTWV